MTTLIIVISHEDDARNMARKIMGLGFQVMGIYSHEPYRDGVRHLPEPTMRARREMCALIDDDDCVCHDFG